MDHIVEPAPLVLLGRSEYAEEVRRTIDRAADIPANVLIAGEIGTGKELIARCVHDGARRSGSFIPVSCRAISLELLEADIFGPSHADDGTGSSRPGKLELAQHGTLFLQDVECLPLPIQAKLSRALQEGKVRRLRSDVPIHNDVRVVAATTADIDALCVSGAFLLDLYWQLSTVQIATVPLREIPEDIPVLFDEFLSQAADRYQREIPGGHVDLIPDLIARTWPGNADELRNAADRFLVGTGHRVRPSPRSLPEQVDHFEKQLIVHYLGRKRGSVPAASEELSIPKTTLYDKLHKYGLSPEDFR